MDCAACDQAAGPDVVDAQERAQGSPRRSPPLQHNPCEMLSVVLTSCVGSLVALRPALAMMSPDIKTLLAMAQSKENSSTALHYACKIKGA
eukprot:718358-Rhodomonas_salina.7